MQEINTHRLTGLLGIFTALFGLSAVLASTVLCGAGCGEGVPNSIKFESDGRFSWSINALSDLGVSRVAYLFNYSIIITGILTIIFTVGFVKAYSKGVLFTLGGMILILGSISLTLVGVITENFGVLHDYVSVAYFCLFPIGIMLVGISFIRLEILFIGYLSFITGILAITSILSGLILRLTLGNEQYISHYGGFAIPEFIEAAIIGLWVTWMGVILVSRSSVRLPK